MPDPTAFISPENFVRGSLLAPGWSGDGVVATPASNGYDDRADTLARYILSSGGDARYDAEFGPDASGYTGVVALVNHNMHGLTVDVSLYTYAGWNQDFDTDPSTTFTFTIPPLPAHMLNLLGDLRSEDIQHTAVLVLPAVARYHAIRVATNIAAPSATIQFGELWAGNIWRPESGIIFETEFGILDPTEQAWTAGGQGYTSARTAGREFTMTFPALTEPEAFGRSASGVTEDNLTSIMARIGKRRPILCSPLGVVPTDEQAWLMHRLATFGFITGDYHPRVIGRRRKRAYRADITVRETR